VNKESSMAREPRPVRRSRPTGSQKFEYASPTVRRPSLRLIFAAGGGVILIVGVAAFLVMKSPAPAHRGDQAPAGPAGPAAPADAGATPPPAADGGAQEYLAAQPFDPAKVLPAPPADGSPRAEADRKIFIATRKLQGTPRWALAQSDEDQSIPATLADFSCALGVPIDGATAPRTRQFFERVALSSRHAVDTAKTAFNRKRPFLTIDGPICVPRTAELAASPDYPSGHSTWIWMEALILAEIAPDRASEILARGRAYGESRVICGAHTASAVEAGRVNGAAIAAALHTSPAFKSDLDLARAEITSLRASGRQPDAAKCAAEANLIATPAY
jgi:acid phosphatase (class A)